MTEMKKIHDFAVKWCDKFSDQNIDYTELIDHWMGDECYALGFEMDCGHAFSEKYGLAANHYGALDKIIDDVTDISLLGSAIYSQWRYFNHWANDGAEILKMKNRAWFILALSRLAILSGDNPFLFQGKLKKMRIVSNNICYGPVPERGEEVEQHLTINDNGNVNFCSYKFTDAGEQYEKASNRNFKIEKSSVNKLLNAVATYFGNEYDEIFVTDSGSWEMELTNTEGIVYKFHGSLCSDFDYEGVDLSDLVRETVGMDDLYVFNGNYKPDVINRITLDYHRVTKIKSENFPESINGKPFIWDYTEQLIIDRETETLEHIQNIGACCKVSRKYEVMDGVENLLDSFDAEELFLHVEEKPDDLIDNPDETKDYRITIDYNKKPKYMIEGSFDKNGLPDDYTYFIESVFDFIRLYGLGEIFNPSLYGKSKRLQYAYMYCSVVFEDDGKSYYYLSDDDSIEIGDFVLVPAGRDNHEAIVEVVNIEYFSEDNVPLPIEMTKKIIRKCTEEDIDSYL